jgi:hypothetical protein
MERQYPGNATPPRISCQRAACRKRLARPDLPRMLYRQDVDDKDRNPIQPHQDCAKSGSWTRATRNSCSGDRVLNGDSVRSNTGSLRRQIGKCATPWRRLHARLSGRTRKRAPAPRFGARQTGAQRPGLTALRAILCGPKIGAFHSSSLRGEAFAFFTLRL